MTESDCQRWRREEDEARAEVARLRALLEDVRRVEEMNRRATGQALAEVERLRAALESAVGEWGRAAAALAVFAERGNWRSRLGGLDVYWIGENEEPWTIAQEALAEGGEPATPPNPSPNTPRASPRRSA